MKEHTYEDLLQIAEKHKDNDFISYLLTQINGKEQMLKTACDHMQTLMKVRLNAINKVDGYSYPISKDVSQIGVEIDTHTSMLFELYCDLAGRLQLLGEKVVF